MHMKTSYLLLPIILLSLASCATPHKVMVLYDRPGSLKPGDRVIWENQTIGSVGDFQANPSGKTVVPMQVKPDFREALTDQSRFLIQSDSDRPGSQLVKMVLLASGGKPLPDGAVVEGSTTFSLMTEKGSRGVQGIPQVSAGCPGPVKQGVEPSLGPGMAKRIGEPAGFLDTGTQEGGRGHPPLLSKGSPS